MIVSFEKMSQVHKLLMLTEEACQIGSPKMITKVFRMAVDLDIEYYNDHPLLRIACVDCLYRNYFHPRANKSLRHAAYAFTEYLLEAYEKTPVELFVEHEQDAEAYSKLLEIHEDSSGSKSSSSGTE
jgi:hypothetical protein